MKELIFIRHAETDMRGLYCGHANPRVNAAGMRQIKSLLHELKDETIDAIVTSDLQRAVTTASSLARHFAISPAIRSQLREINFGEWEGLSWDQIEVHNEAFAQRWIEDFPNLSAPDGEAYEAFRRRVLDEIAAIVKGIVGKHIAVVTHGGVMRVVMQSLSGMGQQEALDTTKGYCAWFRYRALA